MTRKGSLRVVAAVAAAVGVATVTALGVVVAPAAAQASIYVYTDDDPTTTFTGDQIASRADSTTICKTQGKFATQYTALNCGEAFAFLGGFATESGANYTLPQTFGTNIPFNPSAPVRGPTGILIAANWSSMWNGKQTRGFFDANVTQNNALQYWTGLSSTGVANTDNCLGWTSGDFGDAGMASIAIHNTAQYIQLAPQPCGNDYTFMCVCIPKTSSPTRSPSRSPTPKPTPLPTTAAPVGGSAANTSAPSRSPTLREGVSGGGSQGPDVALIGGIVGGILGFLCCCLLLLLYLFLRRRDEDEETDEEKKKQDEQVRAAKGAPSAPDTEAVAVKP